jgi:hypothetical protein
LRIAIWRSIITIKILSSNDIEYILLYSSTELLVLPQSSLVLDGGIHLTEANWCCDVNSCRRCLEVRVRCASRSLTISLRSFAEQGALSRLPALCRCVCRLYKSALTRVAVELRFSSHRSAISLRSFGGRGGIRTHGDISATLDFESSAFNQTQPPFQNVRTLTTRINVD